MTSINIRVRHHRTSLAVGIPGQIDAIMTIWPLCAIPITRVPDMSERRGVDHIALNQLRTKVPEPIAHSISAQDQDDVVVTQSIQVRN
jgi:hypothetical protein